MNKICRLCLKETTITFSIHYTDINGISISSFVKALIPELYLGLSLNPVVCKKCYEQLRQAYIFRLQCLRSENLIGIYIRETKHTENTIILDNVVDYWVKHYKYKPREIKGNLKEWFGTKKDDSGKPIILNQNTNISDLTENASDTEDDVFSEEPSTTTQYIQKDNIYILQKEKTTSESDSQKKDGHAAVDDTVIVTKIPFNTVKIQSNVPSTSGYSDKEDCLTKSKLNTEKEKNKEVNRKEICIMDIIHKIDERMAKSKTVESEIPVNIIEKVGPIRTYIKKPKNAEEEADNTNSQETSTLKVVNAKKRIHLEPYDINDKETACLIEELQKTENLAKLGITANATDEVYVLRKFLNPSDNVVNFALVPKRISENDRNKQIDVLLNVFNQGKTSVKAAGKSGEKSDHNEDLPKVINNKMLNQNASGMTENVEFDSNYTQKGLTCCKVKKYYRKLPPGSHSIKFSKEGNKDNSSISENTGNLDPSAQKSDKESLDSITLSLDSKKADEAIKSADPTSEYKSRSKPMPVIRVRPVSTLQKVRTLNHELWPQKPGFLKLDFEPIKNLNETSPKVINSESASSELVNSSKTPTARILKTYLKRGTIKTKGNAFKPIVLRTINPATLKASGTRHRLIKPKPAPPATTDSSREDSVSEDVIDIKEEPLDYTESNTLDTANFGSNGNNPVTSAESDGEKTRSASETSFMDTLSNQNEILQSIVANIPELGDDQYDEPEYIHINNVSYSDLAKLVDESKKHRDELGKAPTETPDPGTGLSPMSPSNSTRPKILNAKMIKYDNQLLDPIELKPSLGYVRPTKGRKRTGKRLRLVPVDAEGMEIKKVIPSRRRKANDRSVLKKNIASATCTTETSDDRDVCVLFTNFTSEGDYINDHDYLVNPYIRNKMFYNNQSPVCVCLLCDLVHQATGHINHMKSHDTMCQLCQVDFHNVFILNLHVKGHFSYCGECRRTISYCSQIPHAQLHNKSLMLSNIDTWDHIIKNSLDKPVEKPFQRMEEEGSSALDTSKTLTEMLNQPVESKYLITTNDINSGSSNVSPRRSGRVTRKSRKRAVWSEEMLCKALELVKQGTSQHEAASLCLIPRSTLGTRLKNQNFKKVPLGRRSVFTPKQENEMITGMEKLAESGQSITSEVLKKCVFSFAVSNNIPKGVSESWESAGKRWFDIFLRRHPEFKEEIKSVKWRPKRKSVSILRSRKLEIEETDDDEEEAFIYDKTTKSFITPTANKQQKILEKHTSDKRKTELGKNAKDTSTKVDLSSKTQKTDINFSNLLCEESIEGETTPSDISIDKEENPVEIKSQLSVQENVMTKIDLKKTHKKRKSSRRIFSSRSRKRSKILSVSNETEIPLVGSNESLKLETSKLSESDGLETKVDLSESGKSEEFKNEGKIQKSQNTEELTVGSSNAPSLEVPKRNTCGRKSERLRVAVKSKMDYVKTCRKQNRKNKKDTDNPEILKDTQSVEKEGNSTTTQTHESSNITTDVKNFSLTVTDLLKTKFVKSSVQKSKKLMQKAYGTSEDKSSVTLKRASSKLNTAKNDRKKLINFSQQVETQVEIDTTSENSLCKGVSPPTTPEKDSIKMAQDIEMSSPLRGDLKMKIKSIKYNPFVSPNVKTASKKTKISHSNGRATKKRKIDASNSTVLNPTSLFVKEEKQIQQTETSIVDTKGKIEEKQSNKNGKSVEQKQDDGEKDVKPISTISSSKARSSRSRGSLGLVEGLKGSERRNKTPKKAKKIEGSSINTHTSQSENEELNESSTLTNVVVTNSEAFEAKTDEPKESSVISLEESESKTMELDKSGSVDCEKPLENVEPNESLRVMEENEGG